MLKRQETPLPGVLKKDEFVEIALSLNGVRKKARVLPHWTLLHVLREVFGFTGTKEACGEGACGACTVLVEGVPVLACMMLAVEQHGKKVETIEGLQKQDGALHPLQETWLEEYGSQCGFCSPGMIMSAKGYLENHPEATVDEIKEGMGGNICICGNYEHILKAILKGRERMFQRGERHA